MIHAHVTTWFVGLILFIVALYLQRSGKAKGQKIVQMVLRLFYILILATGAYLLMVWQFNVLALIKGLVGLWLIFSMEFILTRGGKGKPTGMFWAQFIIGFILVIYLGYGVLG